jgi:galactitol-specific phosphotransferase system IIB component
MATKAEKIEEFIKGGIKIKAIEESLETDEFYKVNSVHVGKFSTVEDVADITISIRHTQRLEDVYVVIKDNLIIEISGDLYSDSKVHRLIALAMATKTKVI